MKQFQVRIDVDYEYYFGYHLSCRLVSSDSKLLRRLRRRKSQFPDYRCTLWCDPSDFAFNIVEGINTALKTERLYLPPTAVRRLISALWDWSRSEDWKNRHSQPGRAATEISFSDYLEEV